MMKAQNFQLFSVVILSCLWIHSGNGSLEVPGGGYIVSGSDAIMTYTKSESNATWQTCIWSFQKTGDEKEKKCLFVRTVGNTTVKATCELPKLELVSSDEIAPNQCVAKVEDVTESGTWTAEQDFVKESAELKMAHNITSVEILVGNETEGYLVAGAAESVIRCKITGGIPEPLVNYKFVEKSTEDVLIREAVTSYDENNGGLFVQEFYLEPKPEYHGLNLTCSGVIFDKSPGNNSLKLFNSTSPAVKRLNVTFPPSEMGNQSNIGIHAYDNKTVDFAFKANPAPNSIIWERINKTDHSMVFKLDESYGEITALTEEDCKYRVKYAFPNISESEGKDFLYRLNVSNSFGDRLTYFEFNVIPKEEPIPSTTTTTTPTTISTTASSTNNNNSSESSVTPAPEESSSSGGVIFPILGFLIVVGIIVGAVFVYKKRAANRVESAPLSTLRQN